MPYISVAYAPVSSLEKFLSVVLLSENLILLLVAEDAKKLQFFRIILVEAVLSIYLKMMMGSF